MNRKYIDWARDAGVIIVAFAIVLSFFQSGGKGVFGATWAGGTSHTNSKFDAVGGFAVNGTDVITSSTAATFSSVTNSGSETITGSLTVAGIVNSSGTSIGGGTNIVKEVCNTTSTTFGSIAANATTTLDVAVSGATSSQNQVYFVGIATSTAVRVQATAAPSSTTGFATVILENLGSTWNVTTSTVSVCYQQF